MSDKRREEIIDALYEAGDRVRWIDDAVYYAADWILRLECEVAEVRSLPSQRTIDCDAQQTPKEMLHSLTLVRRALGVYMADCGRHLDRIVELERERDSLQTKFAEYRIRIAELERENAELRRQRYRTLMPSGAVLEGLHTDVERIAENERLRIWVDQHDFKYDWRAAPGDVRRAVSYWIYSMRAAIKGENK